MVDDINLVDDYGGHYILGPLFVFLREAFAVGFGVYSGVYLVPKYKKIVFAGFIFLWLMFLLLISFAIGLTFFRMEWTTEKLLRNLTEIIAQLIGLLIAGIFIWKEQKQI
jgi:predicted metal-binding membrane protein